MRGVKRGFGMRFTPHERLACQKSSTQAPEASSSKYWETGRNRRRGEGFDGRVPFGLWVEASSMSVPFHMGPSKRMSAQRIYDDSTVCAHARACAHVPRASAHVLETTTPHTATENTHTANSWESCPLRLGFPSFPTAKSGSKTEFVA